jgi:hypothetical protein
MFIALEASKNHNALVAIEKAFNALNIEVGILNITKEEYKGKVAQQETETLTNISKFGIDTASLPDDDFTKTAIGRRCQTEDDFKRYFKELQHLPEFIDKAVKIQLFDSDPVLEECIIKAQNDEHKTEALNRVYVEATGHSKRKCPLMHDVGLIAGAEYLRLEDKYFVLSEEISINDYSKQSPISHNLPLSIRVLTLINILAMDNGGAEFSADDYMPLFATIIRNGLQPNKNVFQQADLLKLYQLNNQLASLPQRETQDIIKDMHELMVKGEDSDKLSLELDRRITMGKETAKQKEEILRDQLSDTQRSFEREKLEREKKDDALRKVYQGEAQKHHRNKLYKYLAGFLGIIFLMGIVLYFAWTIGDSLKDTSSFAMSLIGGIIIDFILAKIAQLKAIIIYTVDLVKNKSKIISKEVEDKMASI